ncbi:MAG TPA: alpha/beta fold hydrolase [Blastocatellia bacterium]|nr:alpha/beta fold hydrolase [Blastocatellia bacterium]
MSKGHGTHAARGRQSESIELTMPDGQLIRGTLSFAGAEARAPSVIFVHGFGSTRGGEKAVALEAECSRRDWAFAACDFRGHGESGGTMPELRGSRLLEDLDAIITLVANRTAGPAFLVGSSMGGWASAWFAAREPARVKACAFIAPAFHFLEFRSLNKAAHKEFQRTGQHRYQNEFVDAEISYGLVTEMKNYRLEDMAARFRSPLLVFHGMRDDIVPYTDSVDFVSRCASKEVELMLFKTGDHRLVSEKEKMSRMACDFFAARLA